MDVQGSRFHLVHGAGDWGRCTDGAAARDLASLWADDVHTSVSYDEPSASLRLTRDTPLFRRAGRTVGLDADARRGAGRDRYGNWYWIDGDRRSIRWRPHDDRQSSPWWSSRLLAASCAEDVPAPGTFATPGAFTACPPPAPADVVLQGLAVTAHHYLVVGYWVVDPGGGTSEAGLLVFDLHRGGPPLRLVWPRESGFRPWDLADTPSGSLLVLDRDHATYWVLDAGFRLQGHPGAGVVPAFQPVSGPPLVLPTPALPAGFVLVAGSLPGPLRPVSIEPGPDGTVLILDSDPVRGFSVLYLFDGPDVVWSASLHEVVEVIDPRDPTNTPVPYSVLGHDVVYTPGPAPDGPLAPPVVYVADAQGKQVIAFTIEHNPDRVDPRPDFLPLRRWEGKALVRAGTDVYYDFEDRFVPLEVFTECRFESQATITTPAVFDARLPGQPFDSDIPGCAWHRLLLDAQIPTGTSVAIRARANDDADLLSLTPWVGQPAPYLRSDGAELPWYDPWPDERGADQSLPDLTGTWELLFQQVTGRYLQLEVTLQGGGRSSPALRSLRCWFPRFSYLEHYLPAVYREDMAPDAFLERFLANFEGFFTTFEERVEHSHLLLDARTAPPEDLQWLACWFSLVLEPQWNEVQRRFLVGHMDEFYRSRGTVAGLVATLRTYLEPEVDDSLFACTCAPTGGGVRVVERFLTRGRGAVAELDIDCARLAAHRFDVLVPHHLTDDQLAMVNRIVELGKPAHTWFDLAKYWALFVVGQARLGLETQIAAGQSYLPLVLNEGELAAAYLAFPHPFELADRVVVDRDRVGDLPPL